MAGAKCDDAGGPTASGAESMLLLVAIFSVLFVFPWISPVGFLR